MAAVQNASFASPLAHVGFGAFSENTLLDGVLSTITGLSGWTIALTVFLGLVAYDQCTC
jgi:C-22 sterol desaturase